MAPLLGGLFAERTTWRWIFYINFPFCGIGFVTVPLVVRLHAERPPMKERLQNMDWFGSALFIASTTSFLIGVTWGGSQYPWSSWQTVVPIIVGLAGSLATVGWERYGASKPFLRLELFKTYSAIVAYSCAVLQGLVVRQYFSCDTFPEPMLMMILVAVLQALLCPLLYRSGQGLQSDPQWPCLHDSYRGFTPF